MKMLCLFFGLLGLCAFQPAATTYQVNQEASHLAWTGYAEVGSYAPTGTVQLRQGTFLYDGNRLRNGRFEIDMRTIAQEQTQLAEHLRGADFFDVEHYPTAVFALSESQNGQALGQLTLKATTRPVRFPLTITRLPGNQLRIQGTATVDRTQFGVNYNSSSFFQNLGSYAIRNEFLLRFDVVADKQ